MTDRRGFTLAELLVVIAIIAVLSTVALILLNPAQILDQQRDSNRVSNLSSLSLALQDYESVVGGSMGASSTLYISIPDPTATTTAGDQCQGLGLPTSTAYTWHCAASSTYRNIDGTGWIPVNIKSMGSVLPISVLPTDPINTTSSDLFYTYATDGTHYELTAIPESTKQKLALGTAPMIPGYPDVIGYGTNFTLTSLFSTNGLAGEWNFEEGTGTTALDQSGSNNNGTWNGTTPYYTSSGKVGSYGGSFNGNDYVNLGTSLSLNPSALTYTAWIKATSFTNAYNSVISKSESGGRVATLLIKSTGKLACYVTTTAGSINYDGTGANTLSTGQWYFLALTYDSTNGLKCYVNASLDGSVAANGAITTGSDAVWIGAHPSISGRNFNGTIDDARIYSRALSPAEVQALYYAEK